MLRLRGFSRGDCGGVCAGDCAGEKQVQRYRGADIVVQSRCRVQVQVTCRCRCRVQHMQRCKEGAEVQRCIGAEVQWCMCRGAGRVQVCGAGAEVQWGCREADVQMCKVQRFRGAGVLVCWCAEVQRCWCAEVHQVCRCAEHMQRCR